jgi:hypothetical protein
MPPAAGHDRVTPPPLPRRHGRRGFIVSASRSVKVTPWLPSSSRSCPCCCSSFSRSTCGLTASSVRCSPPAARMPARDQQPGPALAARSTLPSRLSGCQCLGVDPDPWIPSLSFTRWVKLHEGIHGLRVERVAGERRIIQIMPAPGWYAVLFNFLGAAHQGRPRQSWGTHTCSGKALPHFW